MQAQGRWEQQFLYQFMSCESATGPRGPQFHPPPAKTRAANFFSPLTKKCHYKATVNTGSQGWQETTCKTRKLRCGVQRTAWAVTGRHPLGGPSGTPRKTKCQSVPMLLLWGLWKVFTNYNKFHLLGLSFSRIFHKDNDISAKTARKWLWLDHRNNR